MKKSLLSACFLSTMNFIESNAALQEPIPPSPNKQINISKVSPVNSSSKDQLLKKLNIAENNLKKTQEELPNVQQELKEQEEKFKKLNNLANQSNPNKIDSHSIQPEEVLFLPQDLWDWYSLETDTELALHNTKYLEQKETAFQQRITDLSEVIQSYKKQLQIDPKKRKRRHTF